MRKVKIEGVKRGGEEEEGRRESWKMKKGRRVEEGKQGKNRTEWEEGRKKSRRGKVEGKRKGEN